ncbi:MAG: type VI secretion system contractile sheath large subunit [Myxococcales bacterium]|nr:type VI secretion system contractile sheath large subunit [Myxococcales bacterium]
MSEEDKKGGLGGFSIGFGGPAAPARPAARDAASQAEERPVDGPLEVDLEDKGTFRVVFLAPLTPSREVSLGAPPALLPLPVDKYTFDAQFKELAPAFVVEVDDPFDPGGEKLRFDLRLSELKSFRPDGMVDAAPPVRALMEARKTVLAVRNRTLSPSDARRALERILPRPGWAFALTPDVGTAVAPPPAKKDDSPLGALFDQIDVVVPVAEAPAPPPPSPIAPEGGVSQLVAAIARTARSPAQRLAEVGSSLERLDAAIVALLGSIFADPEVSRLERAWRSARLLVDRLDFRAGVELDLVPAHVEDVSDALAWLAQREGDESRRAPIDLLLVDPPLDPSPRDFDRLEVWAGHAANLRAPLLVEGAPTHLGFESIAALQRSERRLEAHDEPRARALRAFGASDDSRWVTLGINPLVLRNAHTKESARLRELAFEEPADAHLFGNPCLAVVGLAATSWVKNGWASDVTGPRGGAFENLPVHQVVTDGVEMALPIQTFVSTDTQRSVAKAGVLLLGCAPNHDAAIVAAAPMLHRGKETEVGPDAPASSRLGDQLFVARLSHVVEQLGAAIPAEAPAAAAKDVARLALAELFKAGGKRVEVVADVKGDRLEVTVRPGGFASVSLPEVSFSVRRG